MKNFFAAIVLVLTTATISAGIVFWYLSPNSPNFPNSQNQSSAAKTISNSSAKFQPGLDTLNDYYSRYPNLVQSAIFEIILKGKLKSLSSQNLVLTSGFEEINLDLDPKNIPGFMSSNGKAASADKIKSTDLKPNDNLEIHLRLNPFTGKIRVSFVIKTS